MKKTIIMLFSACLNLGFLFSQETSFEQIIGVYKDNLLYKQTTYHFDNKAYSYCEVILLEKEISSNTVLWTYRIEQYKMSNTTGMIFDRIQYYEDIIKKRPEFIFGSLYLTPNLLDYYEKGEIYIHINEDDYLKIDAYSLIPDEYARTGEVVCSLIDSYKYNDNCILILKFTNGDEETNIYEKIAIININDYL